MSSNVTLTGWKATELVRYYRMEYSSITGWRHRGNSTAVSYYLSFF